METVNELLPLIVRASGGGRMREIVLESLVESFAGKIDAGGEELLEVTASAVLWGWENMTVEDRRRHGSTADKIIENIQERFGQQEGRVRGERYK